MRQIDPYSDLATLFSIELLFCERHYRIRDSTSLNLVQSLPFVNTIMNITKL